jgi:hypothetical protein
MSGQYRVTKWAKRRGDAMEHAKIGLNRLCSVAGAKQVRQKTGMQCGMSMRAGVRSITG